MFLKLYLVWVIQLVMLVVGMLVTLMSNKVIGLWMGLEMKLFAFLPFLLSSPSSVIYYFIIQVMGSMGVLLGVIFPEYFFFFTLGLGLKLGMFPFYYWFVAMVREMGWLNIWMLAIVQKFHLLILFPLFFKYFTLILVMLTLMIVSLHLLFSTMKSKNNKEVISLISIIDSATLSLLYFFNLVYGVIYFILYGLLFFFLMYSFDCMNKMLIILLSVLTMSGFPPFFGFFLKMKLILFCSIGLSLWELLFILVPLLVQLVSFLVMLMSLMVKKKTNLEFTNNMLLGLISIFSLKVIWLL